MSLQARVQRRLQRLRGAVVGASHGRTLLDYLATGSTTPPTSRQLPGGEPDHPLRAAAQAMLRSNESLRLGLRAGELHERVGWFQRLLALSPAAEREEWLRGQLAAAQRHALAGSPLHDILDARLFDAGLPDELRLRLQSLWLAMVAPGAVSLDADRREREQAEAMALLATWL